MAPSHFLPLLLLSLLHHPSGGGAAAPPTIEEICTHAEHFEHPFNHQLCIDSLTSDPGSPGAVDARDFAAVAANQALVKVQAAWDAATLRRRDPVVASILSQYCASLYKGLQDTVQTSIFLLQNDLKVPAMKAAREELVGGRDRSRQCPDAFSNAGKPSPVAHESSDVTDMLQISVAILDLALN